MTHNVKFIMFTILIGLMEIVFLLLLPSCEFTPYWDQGQSSPDIPNTSIPFNEPDKWKEYTVIGTVNIRATPSSSAPTIGWLVAGAKVLANCNRDDGWCQVPGGYIYGGCLGLVGRDCLEK